MVIRFKPGRAYKIRSDYKLIPKVVGGDSAFAAVDLSAKFTLLRQAVNTRTVDPSLVIDALERLEESNLQSSLVSNFPSCLNGSWRLVFAIPAPIKAWSYIPVMELAIIESPDTIGLVSLVGPLKFTFSGKCRFHTSEKTFDMIFAFDRSKIEAFGRLLVDKQRGGERKEKTYSFFYVQDDLAAANSSGTGGKVLMHREKLP